MFQVLGRIVYIYHFKNCFEFLKPILNYKKINKMIPLFKVFMNNNMEPVLNTLNSGMITQSQKVEEFESKLKEWFDYKNILTVNSATSGLTLALRLLNLKEGDEVLCTPLTCFATTCSVLANKLKIKWVDVDVNTCNMDLDDLKYKISSSTKAILVVHWGGSPIDLDKLKNIAGDIPIIEDCAHAFGAEYNGKKIGCHENIAVFSLQAIKHLTTGDGLSLRHI
jgi:dTDP-4-amino-4,6-dideoxygalactose transaminase